ncbi:MAG: protocatechuate 3,4-dioxygenase subunit alpha [Alphaproteobacteria bacterium]|nr:protocatechuate 3,4-dioxygenase subunit alpha [Alphaproteobacteria bacterium]
MTRLIPTCSQTVGPFYHFALARPEWSNLARKGAKGRKMHVEGRVLDGDGKPCRDAFLELWQANAAGRYNHPDDMQDKPLDAGFVGFGRALTDAKGCYRFTTIMPGPVPGRGNALQAPHIAVNVFARGILKHLATRIYFADQQEANAADPVLGLVHDPARRATLIARPAKPGRDKVPVYRFDIRLQGDGETVFFDV